VSTTDATPTAHASFALALHRALAGDRDATTACAPWSVSSALAALAAGATPAVRAEVADALGVAPEALPTLADEATALVAGRDAPGDDVALVLAQSLWLDESLTPTPTFTDALARWPGAHVHRATLASDPAGVRVEVNDDVRRTTRGLVPEVLPPGGLSEADRAVLVTALYLREPWAVPFDASATELAPFAAATGSRRVPTMQAEPEVPYAHAYGWAYASLPLRHGLRAEVLLPDGPLDAAEAGLDGGMLARLREEASDHRLTLSLPRFGAAGGGGLVDALHAVGAGGVLDAGRAPLPGVATDGHGPVPLAVTRAYHRAVLQVDERGVEGAAATAFVARPVMFRELPEARMRVDRPFLLLVTHRHTGAVLFCARVTAP
jgi:serine protease inhibitor